MSLSLTIDTPPKATTEILETLHGGEDGCCTAADTTARPEACLSLALCCSTAGNARDEGRLSDRRQHIGALAELAGRREARAVPAQGPMQADFFRHQADIWQAVAG